MPTFLWPSEPWQADGKTPMRRAEVRRAEMWGSGEAGVRLDRQSYYRQPGPSFAIGRVRTRPTGDKFQPTRTEKTNWAVATFGLLAVLKAAVE
jgi:hypothetical protein